MAKDTVLGLYSIWIHRSRLNYTYPGKPYLLGYDGLCNFRPPRPRTERSLPELPLPSLPLSSFLPLRVPPKKQQKGRKGRSCTRREHGLSDGDIKFSLGCFSLAGVATAQEARQGRFFRAPGCPGSKLKGRFLFAPKDLGGFGRFRVSEFEASPEEWPGSYLLGASSHISRSKADRLKGWKKCINEPSVLQLVSGYLTCPEVSETEISLPWP